MSFDLTVRVSEGRFFSVIIIGSILCNISVSETFSIYFSFVTILLAAIYSIINHVNKKTINILLIWFLIVVFNFLASRLVGDTLYEYENQLAKITSFIFVVGFISQTVKDDDYKFLFSYFPFGIVFFILLEFIINGISFSYGHGRLTVGDLGSPNALGSIVGIAVILGIENIKMEQRKLLNVLAIIFFIPVLLLLASRAILLILIIIILYKYRAKALIWALPIILISIFLIINSYERFSVILYDKLINLDVLEDPRIRIWSLLLDNLLKEPYRLITGSGIGSVMILRSKVGLDLQGLDYKYLYHAHNSYFQILYEYGLIVFLLFISILVRVYKRVRYSEFPTMIFVYYLMIFLLDYHISNLATILLHALIISYFFKEKDLKFHKNEL
jgi:O-antigen ligase